MALPIVLLGLALSAGFAYEQQRDKERSDKKIASKREESVALQKEMQETQKALRATNIREQTRQRKRMERINRAVIRQNAFSSGVASSSSATTTLGGISTQSGASSAFQAAQNIYSDVLTQQQQRGVDIGIETQMLQEAQQQQSMLNQFGIDLGLNVATSFLKPA